MSGNTRLGSGPASELHSRAEPGTIYQGSKGNLEWKTAQCAWAAVQLSASGGFNLREDFPLKAGATLPLPWGKQDTSPAGTPTLDYADNAPGGQYVMKLTADNEAQAITLYTLDQLLFDPTKKARIEFRIKLQPDITGTSGELGAGDIIVFGLASARTAVLDDIAEHAWFRLQGDGANKNILYETDDGTTDNDDNDTGIDWEANVWLDCLIDAFDLSEVLFVINGIVVGNSDWSQATGPLQPFVEVTKAAAANNDHRVTVDFADTMQWDR